MSPRKPSLLIVSHTYAIDAHAQKLVALAQWFDVLCVTVRQQDLGLPITPPEKLDPRIEAIRLPLPVWGSVKRNRFLYRGLRAIMRQRRWDFVLAEVEPWMPHKWQGLILARTLGTVRCYGEFTWENVKRPGLKGRVLTPVYQLTARTVDFWMAGNRAAAALLRSAGTPPERILTCTQVGVDVDANTPPPPLERETLRLRHGLPTKAFIAGFAGRLVPEKGVRELIAAIRQLHTEGHDSIHVAIMGSGELEHEIRTQAAACPWLHLLPAVPYEDVMKHLPVMDLLVLGSHPVRQNGRCWEEQFGHILIEAMAVGTVVAGSTSGAIPEVIGDESMLFPVGDEKAVANLIRRCALDAPFFNAKRDLQLQRVRELFSHQAVATHYHHFLNAITPRR